MSNYYLDSERYQISFGYDQYLKGFWLVIHQEYDIQFSQSQFGKDQIFNNIVDWPGGVMSINDIKYVLEKFGERIPAYDLYQLYLEAESCGYFSTLSFKDFCYPAREIYTTVIKKKRMVYFFQRIEAVFYQYFKPTLRRVSDQSFYFVNIFLTFLFIMELNNFNQIY